MLSTGAAFGTGRVALGAGETFSVSPSALVPGAGRGRDAGVGFGCSVGAGSKSVDVFAGGVARGAGFGFGAPSWFSPSVAGAGFGVGRGLGAGDGLELVSFSTGGFLESPEAGAGLAEEAVSSGFLGVGFAVLGSSSLGGCSSETLDAAFGVGLKFDLKSVCTGSACVVGAGAGAGAGAGFGFEK